MTDVDGTCGYELDPEVPETWGGEEGEEFYISEEVLNVDGVWSCPHDTKDGEELCIFHLPTDSKNSDNVTTAFIDILKQLSEEPNTYTQKSHFINAKFGEMDLSDKTLPEINDFINLSYSSFESEVSWEGTTINSDLYIRGATFQDEASFRGSNFNRTVKISSTVFKGRTLFGGAIFEDKTDFWTVKFESQALIGAEFINECSFQHSTFEERTGFGGASFEDEVSFRDVTFKKLAGFRTATFNDRTKFSSVSFESEVRFGQYTFNDFVDFSSTTFEGLAKFDGVVFDKVALFWDANFENDCNFNNAKFNNSVHFDRANFNCSPTFEDAIFSDGIFVDANFNEELCFQDATFTGVGLFWGVTFNDDANFNNTTFQDGGHFVESKFVNDALFIDADFMGSTSVSRFVNTLSEHEEMFSLKKPIDANDHYSYIQYKENVEAGFVSTSYEDQSGFEEVIFEGVARFTNSTHSNANFKNCVFNKNSEFNIELSTQESSTSMFQDSADFSGVTARGTLDFLVIDNNQNLSTDVLIFDGKVDFTDATLSDGCNFECAKFSQPPTFTGAKLNNCNFSNSKLDGADFSNANLTDVSFRESSLQGANLEATRLSRTNLTGADLRGAALAESVLTDARIDDTTRFLQPPVDDLPIEARLPRLVTIILPGVSSAIPVCGYDPEFTSPNDADDYNEWPEKSLNKAKSVYRAIENLAGLSSRPQLKSRAFIRRQDIQRKQYHQTTDDAHTTISLDRVLDRTNGFLASAARWVFLYGESPWRIIGWSLGVITLFALIYPFGLMKPTDGAPLTWDAVFQQPSLLIESFYYSILTYTALGFGDFRPVDEWGQAATVLETSLGAVLLALLVFVLGRKAAR
jgi:uncharacterized protein YjbI with pentapeptide repeats